MFERFRIKTALRGEVIRLRDAVDQDGLAKAEMLFFEPAFVVASDMKRERWTPEQAMVFMVTDVVREIDLAGNFPDFARDEPGAYAALGKLYHHVLAKAKADPALASCIRYAPDGGPVRFVPQPE